jgi:hypothetical protein
MKRVLGVAVGAALLTLSAASLPVRAQDEKSYTLTIKDHKFEPARLEVPANTKIKLIIKNLDSTAEEFEMLNPAKREKVVKGGQEGSLFVGPFKPGTYEFFGEFNPKTARGQIVAK